MSTTEVKTINQLVSLNIARQRTARGWSQAHLSGLLQALTDRPWSVASISAAEQGWAGKRVRKFDADELVALARAFGLPVSALLTPPPDLPGDHRYSNGGEEFDADRLHEVVTQPGEVPGAHLVAEVLQRAASLLLTRSRISADDIAEISTPIGTARRAEEPFAPLSLRGLDLETEQWRDLRDRRSSPPKEPRMRMKTDEGEERTKA